MCYLYPGTREARIKVVPAASVKFKQSLESLFLSQYFVEVNNADFDADRVHVVKQPTILEMCSDSHVHTPMIIE